MLILLSPAKSLDFESPIKQKTYTEPAFLGESAELISALRALSPPEIGQLMKISDALADLNFGRFLNWHQPFTPENARQAVLAFQGDVYQGLEAVTFSKQDVIFAQAHLRILSGLYGVLKPYDLIQPYRLEMGSKFENNRGKNLYAFWGNLLTEYLNEILETQGSQLVINLASNEYFKSIKTKLLNADVVIPVFKDQKNGEYKIISFYAKKARGMMASFIIKHQITTTEALKAFDTAGYYFVSEDSDEKQLVFKRDQTAE